MPQLPGIIGLIGVVIILGSYYALQTHKIQVQEFRYSVLNAIGSLFVLYSLWYEWNLASVVVEVSWLFISLIGVGRALLKAREPS